MRKALSLYQAITARRNVLKIAGSERSFCTDATVRVVATPPIEQNLCRFRTSGLPAVPSARRNSHCSSAQSTRDQLPSDIPNRAFAQ